MTPFLWQIVKRYHRQLALVAVITILGSLSTLAIPWLISQLLGGVLGSGAYDLPRLAGLLVLALALMTGFNTWSSVLTARTAGQLVADLRLQMYSHVQRLPMRYHEANEQGDLLSVISIEAVRLSSFLMSTLGRMPAMLVTAGGAMILLLLIDIQLALVVPLVAPVIYILLKIVGKRLKSIGQRSRDAEARLVSTVQTDLEMVSSIKSYAVEDYHRAKVAARLDDARRLAVEFGTLSAITSPLIAFLSAVAAVGILLLAEARLETASDPTELFSFLLYAALLTRPIGSLGDFYGQVQWFRGTLARLEDVASQPLEPGYEGQIDDIEVRGEIRFEDVTFTYPGRPDLLRQMNLAIEAGEIVALTGVNGAGKSTILKLLQRFYDPDEGCVFLDSHDIRTLSVQTLRRAIGVVPQRALLFNGTIRENIAFGDPAPSEAKLQRAMELAQACQFVTTLAEGMDTLIGDHGLRLSGGQRQRISLARALYYDPPILVFDEATSMFDSAGEAAFVDACRSALHDRTVIIVTHRPASLALAHRVLKIEDGKAIEGVRS